MAGIPCFKNALEKEIQRLKRKGVTTKSMHRWHVRVVLTFFLLGIIFIFLGAWHNANGMSIQSFVSYIVGMSFIFIINGSQVLYGECPFNIAEEKLM